MPLDSYNVAIGSRNFKKIPTERRNPYGLTKATENGVENHFAKRKRIKAMPNAKENP